MSQWRAEIQQFCDSTLLCPQNRQFVRPNSTAEFVQEGCWRAALLAFHYSYCEEASEFLKYFEPRSIGQISLPRKGSAYFTWKGRFPPLDRVKDDGPKGGPRSDLAKRLREQDEYRRKLVRVREMNMVLGKAMYARK